MPAADEPSPAVLDGPSGEAFGVAVAPIRLAGETPVAVATAVPYDELMAERMVVRDAVLAAGVAAAFGAVALAVWLGRSLARPLAQMTDALERFGAGETIDVPTAAGGEIGVLARAFAHMAGDVRDKTRALGEEAKRRRRILDAALDAFIEMDHQGKVVEWNPQAEALFGWTRAEAVGRKLADLVVPQDQRAAHEAGIVRFRRTGEGRIVGRRVELDAVRRDGRRIRVELTVTAIREGDEYSFAAFVRDLTEKIAVEEQLRQAQKMESIGQLTGGVAHDFNNILTVIIGNAEMLAQETNLQPEAKESVARIGLAADRGAELTRRLLAVARRQALDPRPTNVNTLVREATAFLQSSLGEHIEIALALDPAAAPAMIDPGELTPALLNLAVNARDAMPGGGRLTIETRNVVLDEAYARANIDGRPGPYVMVAVSDTGVGISPDILPRVLEPFFTTKEAGKGTGLGLSMVYGFIRQSGGHMKIYSEVGHGTTVKLYLPQAEGAPEIVPATAERPLGGQERILLVEDDAMVRAAAIAQLESLGYRVIVAETGAKALELVRGGIEFDLLFTDVVMPGGLNGRQLAEEVAKLRPGTKVLYTSGYAENAIVHHGRLDPGVALLNKPYRQADLARKLCAVLYGGRAGPIRKDA
jgi:PAS domain S-box-containing protein